MAYLFLETPGYTLRAKRFFKKLYNAARAAGLDAVLTNRYEPGHILVLYGPGGPDRWPHVQRQMANGDLLIVFDVGYWDRDEKFRVSVNGLHPHNIMIGPHPGVDRWNRSPRRIDQYLIDETAPILLIGNAPKSIAIGAEGWAAAKSHEIRRQFPDHKIIYRPKPNRPPEKNVTHDVISHHPSIFQVMRKCSLVVCRHSNVAVDAATVGIPVVTDDGAASAIYPSDLIDYELQPDAPTRLEFLERLAYYQWAGDEVNDFWRWFLEYEN